MAKSKETHTHFYCGLLHCDSRINIVSQLIRTFEIEGNNEIKDLTTWALVPRPKTSSLFNLVMLINNSSLIFRVADKILRKYENFMKFIQISWIRQLKSWEIQSYFVENVVENHWKLLRYRCQDNKLICNSYVSLFLNLCSFYVWTVTKLLFYVMGSRYFWHYYSLPSIVMFC